MKKREEFRNSIKNLWELFIESHTVRWDIEDIRTFSNFVYSYYNMSKKK